MWIQSSRRAFFRKKLRLVMNGNQRKVNENASHSAQPSSSQHCCNYSYYMAVRQYEESRVPRTINLEYLCHSQYRVNQIQLCRHIATNQQNHKSVSGQETQIDPSLSQQNVWRPLREWKIMKNQSNCASFKFKLMTYNVLAQELKDNHPELYSRDHKPEHLQWDYRWKKLKQEFQFHDADVICLQEVQQSHFDEFMNFFNGLGYNGIFKQRTGGEHPDGCAIFYKTSILQMLEHKMVEYFHPGSRILNRNNVGIIAKLKARNDQHSFAVATTHLLFNPKREDVRLAQMQVLLTELNQFSYDDERKENIPVILCGDFNSEEGNGLYRFITNSRFRYSELYSQHGDKRWLPPSIGITNGCKYFRERGADEGPLTLAKQMDLFESGVISHDFIFKSVYGPEGVTTNQNRWIAVDYMFVSVTNRSATGRLECLRRYELPTKSGLKSYGIRGIPNCKLGSDHFSLVAEFGFVW